jgi:hypothetical protein
VIPSRRGAGGSAWLGSIIALVAVIVAFFATTQLTFDLQYASEAKSFGFNFSSSMDWWYHLTLLAVLIGGVALGVVATRRGESRALAWTGIVLNAIAAALLVAFLGMAVMQGAFR